MHISSAVTKISMGKDKASSYYCHQNDENSLAVIFPDGDYSCDRPLLYYARKAALTAGYDVLCISYVRRLTWRDMGYYTIELEADSSIDTIKKCLRKPYKGICFISKGIGGEIAGAVSNRLDYGKTGSIYLTPTHHSINHITNSKCIVITGSSDGIFTQDYVNQALGHKNVELIIYKDADRCLEVIDDIGKSLEILVQVAGVYSRFFKEQQ